MWFFKKSSKKKKFNDFMDSWRKRTDFNNIHIKNGGETIEAYYFASKIIDNLVLSYQQMSNIQFDALKLEEAKHFLAGIVLFYLYCYETSFVSDGDFLGFNCGRPCFSELASFLELQILEECYENGDGSFKFVPVVKPFSSVLGKLGHYPFLADMADKYNLQQNYHGYKDVIKICPDAHPFLFKLFSSFAAKPPEYIDDLVRICVMALQ